MFSELSNWLLELIKTHGILAVVLGVLLETIIVPLPSPLILMAAGYILIPHTNIINIITSVLLIALVAGITQTIGSFYYISQDILSESHLLRNTKKSMGFPGMKYRNLKKNSRKKMKQLFYFY